MGRFYLLSGCRFSNRFSGDCFSFSLHHDWLSYRVIANPLATAISRLGSSVVIQYSKLIGRRTVIVLAYCTDPVALSGKLDPSSFLTLRPTRRMISPILPHPVIMWNSKANWVFLVNRALICLRSALNGLVLSREHSPIVRLWKGAALIWLMGVEIRVLCGVAEA